MGRKTKDYRKKSKLETIISNNMEKISSYLPDFLKPLKERKLRFDDITDGEVVSIIEEVWDEFKSGSYRG